MTSYPIAAPEIIYRDVFNLKEIYELIHDWLDDEGFRDPMRRDMFIEKYYHERRIQNVGKEIRIWWRTLKKPSGSQYFRYRLNVDYFIIAMKDVDVVRDGKKVRANQGELQIKITGILDVDYKEHMDKGSILRAFKRIFEKVWMKNEKEYHESWLLKKIGQLEAEIKNHLNLKGFTQGREPFRPRYTTQ